ncbi:MAG: cell division protein FtsA [Deltaproteobacteria bacterium]|nr:cell division protein FtsA [Deltaproteobacteria bacterium]
MKDTEIIAALDIGTTKVCCVVATPSPGDELSVVGIGNAPSTGVAKGAVNHFDRVVSGIVAAVREAELMAGCQIKNVYLGVAGGNVTCYNTRGVVGVRDTRRHVITEDDKRRAQRSALSLKISPDEEILHQIEQEYAVDDLTDIRDPLNMCGERLEVNMHVTTVSVNAIQNIVNCVKAAGLRVDDDDIILESIASADAVLSPQEKEAGVAVLDFGGGTTDIAIFVNGAIRHTKVLNLGGNDLTRDILKTLMIPMDAAEALKVENGCCYPRLLDSFEEPILIPAPGERRQEVGRHTLADILTSRTEEIFAHVNEEIIGSGFDSRVMEIVLTGGSSLLLGAAELAREIFERPARVGFPVTLGGLSRNVSSPKFSMVLGLLLFGYYRDQSWELADDKKRKGFWGSLFSRFKKRLDA